MSAILDLLANVGYVADTPGAYLRGAISGKFGERSSGQDLLSSYGLDAGPIGGFAAEMATDPLAILGPAYGALKGIKGINKATAAAKAIGGIDDLTPLARRLSEFKLGVDTPMDAVRASSRLGETNDPIKGALARFLGDETGAMSPSFNLGRRTDPDIVNKADWFHGSPTPGLTADALDPLRSHQGGMLGRGIYMAGDPQYAQTYMKGPGRSLYRARTDLQGIADLDLPTTPGIAGGMRDLLVGAGGDAAKLDRQFKHYDDVPLWDYLSQYLAKQKLANPSAAWSAPAKGPDALLDLLRSNGLDALLHTEGRHGRHGVDVADILNQSLSVLDPGRIKSFDPLTGI